MDGSRKVSPVYGICRRRTNYILGTGIVLALIGASLLVAFGLLYVRPYIYIRHMTAAECTTNAAAGTGDLVPCTCASDGTGSCTSQYPCLHIAVNYTTEHDDTVIVNATLYDSYETFTIQSTTQKCSYHKCDRVPLNNFNAVQHFGDIYGVIGTKFMCFADPGNPSYVIQDIVTRSMVVHSMFWPMLSLVVGLAIVLTYIFRIDSGNNSDNEEDNDRPMPSSLERRLVRVGDRTMILSGEEQVAN